MARARQYKHLFINTNPIGGKAFIDVRIDFSECQGLVNGDFATMSKEAIVGPMCKFMALGSREGLSEILSPRSKIGGIQVGTTGVASANLSVAEMTGSSFGAQGESYAVFEGPYPQNKYIRTGTPPQRPPPMEKIRAWIIAKGLQHFQNNMQLQQGFNPTPRRQTRDPIIDFAYRIQHGIARRGTSVAHKPLYPAGQKRFDYVVFAVKKLKMVDQLWTYLKQNGMPQANKVLVGFLRTGKWDKNSAFSKIKTKKFKV